ncbi:HAMP domain-containing sensor histidine kinase [Bacteroides sp. ET489]|uniref:sensor histidine kinase n=1 Tax=Bacteroides sp. ET489 TaxID=3057126 RepID=UPI0026710394|nr:HAMP domain-containing sensor histidine kinase [Bacteroides sp. ET489]MDO3389616.1 HAMP domain-containing sensor histidine kinase [Bacteroides sp. ET489]
MKKYIKIFTILGLMSILIIQFTWLYSSFQAIKQNIARESNMLLKEAIDREVFIRIDSLNPTEDIVVSQESTLEGEVKVQTEFLQEAALKYGSDVSLYRLQTIFNNLLLENEMPEIIRIDKIIDNDSILEFIGTTKSSWGDIKTKRIPIRLDRSVVLQAVLANPVASVFKRMGLLIVATAILMFFVIGCLFYQIRIILKLNRISQIREDFSYALIHDMKNPLSTIFTTLNFLHTGRLDDKPEKREKYFRIAEGEVDHLLTLTNKVLTVSKLEQHKLDMQKEKIELLPMIDKLVDKFTAKADKPICFIKDLQATEVYADAEYLEEVLDNLIDNAVKYSKENVEITLSSSCNGRHTFLRVHDNGIGISDKDQKVIFNKYERGAAGRRKRKQGASGFGLGLNFVQQVVEAHGGNIFVNSIEGEFTEFVISLPLQDLN